MQKCQKNMMTDEICHFIWHFNDFRLKRGKRIYLRNYLCFNERYQKLILARASAVDVRETLRQANEYAPITRFNLRQRENCHRYTRWLLLYYRSAGLVFFFFFVVACSDMSVS